MKARNIIEQMLAEDVYKLSSTQVNLPVALADYVINWGREMIPDDDLYYDEKGNLGRESEMHVTLLYGLVGAKPSKELLKLVRETLPFTVKLTSVTKFDNNPDYDVVKFDVESDEMKSLSDAIHQACQNENKFPVWKGHVTLAYVKKGKVPDIEGNYPFLQDPPVSPEFEVNEVIFKPAGDSEDPKRKPIRIPLNRYKKEAEDPKTVFRKVVTGAAKPRVTNGLEYADVTWEDIKRLKAAGLIGDYVPFKLGLRQHRGDGAFQIAGNHIADHIEIELDLRRLRWYRWVSEGEEEEEDEDAAVARLKKKYGLGEPDYDLAKAERRAGTQGHTQDAAKAAARAWLVKHKRQEAEDPKTFFHHQLPIESKARFVRLAVQAAELVLPIFTEKFPNDDRPAKAIQAAKNWLEHPGQIDAAATRAAAHAAAETAYATAARTDAAADGAAAAAYATGHAAADAVAAAYAVAATTAAFAAAFAAADAPGRFVHPGLKAQIKAIRDQIKKLRGIAEAEDPKTFFRHQLPIESKTRFVRLAVQAAELVLPLFTEKFPNDDRPAKAIQAAKNWLEHPSQINVAAARAAAHAAAETANIPAACAVSAAAYAAAYAANAASDDYAASADFAASAASYAASAP